MLREHEHADLPAAAGRWRAPVGREPADNTNERPVIGCDGEVPGGLTHRRALLEATPEPAGGHEPEPLKRLAHLRLVEERLEEVDVVEGQRPDDGHPASLAPMRCPDAEVGGRSPAHAYATPPRSRGRRWQPADVVKRGGMRAAGG